MEGNVWLRPTPPPGQPAPPPKVTEIKWTEADFADYKDGKLPMGKATDPEWSFGDVEGGFKNAALVLDETFARIGSAISPKSGPQSLQTSFCANDAQKLDSAMVKITA